MRDMRTPLGKVRGLGSAKDGTEHFWHIRLTAVALVPLSLFVIGWVLSLRGVSVDGVRASLAQPLVALPVALFLVAALFHMRLGMQIIIEDYVHGEGSKVVLLMLNTFFTIAIGVVSLFALLKLSFGG
ncbi:MAG: succinate dehydrogenase, hydrophobic membrane anchor protein [Rhizobiales bacterium]|nr:succinate dehydrogenase, hydrophobic membrane anchor protein [Hyphomicrobiales bacterium]MBN9262633.1 succinate dehydrogenase, hydrophobic membrane anchor protein [Hyphomicrobium sp.]